jgi:hypothetical protein
MDFSIICVEHHHKLTDSLVKPAGGLMKIEVNGNRSVITDSRNSGGSESRPNIFDRNLVQNHSPGNDMG